MIFYFSAMTVMFRKNSFEDKNTWDASNNVWHEMVIFFGVSLDIQHAMSMPMQDKTPLLAAICIHFTPFCHHSTCFGFTAWQIVITHGWSRFRKYRSCVAFIYTPQINFFEWWLQLLQSTFVYILRSALARTSSFTQIGNLKHCPKNYLVLKSSVLKPSNACSNFINMIWANHF